MSLADNIGYGPFKMSRNMNKGRNMFSSIYCVFHDKRSKAVMQPYPPTNFNAASELVSRRLLHFLKDFTGRATTRVGYTDAGSGAKISQLASEEGSDVFIPISIDRKAADTYSGGCTDLCYPRSMTLTIGYYQLDTNTKRIIDATLAFHDFDKDSTLTDYTLTVAYYPLDYWDLIIKFAFERTVFIALFVVVGCISVLVASLYWVNVRITTQVMKFTLTCMLSPVYSKL